MNSVIITKIITKIIVPRDYYVIISVRMVDGRRAFVRKVGGDDSKLSYVEAGASPESLVEVGASRWASNRRPKERRKGC